MPYIFLLRDPRNNHANITASNNHGYYYDGLPSVALSSLVAVDSRFAS